MSYKEKKKSLKPKTIIIKLKKTCNSENIKDIQFSIRDHGRGGKSELYFKCPLQENGYAIIDSALRRVNPTEQLLSHLRKNDGVEKVHVTN